MFAVEIYAAVRRFVFVEGKSRREAARVFGLSRDTIAKMCRYSAPPGYVRSKAPERPKLGPLVPVIDAILEPDKTAPPKQRHTAKRIFERLRIEHGYAGGYTVVKDYVRIPAPGRARPSCRWPIRLLRAKISEQRAAEARDVTAQMQTNLEASGKREAPKIEETLELLRRRFEDNTKPKAN